MRPNIPTMLQTDWFETSHADLLLSAVIGDAPKPPVGKMEATLSFMREMRETKYCGGCGHETCPRCDFQMRVLKESENNFPYDAAATEAVIGLLRLDISKMAKWKCMGCGHDTTGTCPRCTVQQIVLQESDPIAEVYNDISGMVKQLLTTQPQPMGRK